MIYLPKNQNWQNTKDYTEDIFSDFRDSTNKNLIVKYGSLATDPLEEEYKKNLLKKTFNYSKWLAYFLIFVSLVLLSLSSFYIYADNQMQEVRNLFEQCQQLVKSAREDKLPLTDEELTCPDYPKEVFDSLNSQKNAQNIQVTINKINFVKKELSAELEIVQTEIESLKSELKLLQIQIPELSDLSSENSLKENLDKKKEYLDLLKKMVADGFQSKIQTEIDKFKENLDKFKEFDLKEEEEFLQKYRQNSRLQQIQNIDQLKENLKKLEEKILQKIKENNLKFRQELKDKYKEFTGQDFKNLFFQAAKTYQKVNKPSDDLANITGDEVADLRIVRMAENRGYVKQNVAIEKYLVNTQNGQKLQVEALEALEKLQAAAKKDGIDLVLVSGYRSISEQKDIFLSRIGSFTTTQIISGSKDNLINQVLTTSSIPGYSRHHTGYTFDLGCGNSDLLRFAYTPCFEWLSKDNYLNAKIFGIIPSYPDGAGLQGPDPEAWEYVWVGENYLLK